MFSQLPCFIAAPIKIPGPAHSAAPDSSWFSPRRLFAYTIRETLELLRDPIRLGFSLFGTTLLMLVFGFGVSTDVNNLSFAVLDHDQTPESRAYLEELRGSSYFVEKPPLADYQELDNRLRSGNIKAAVEIPPASAATSNADVPLGSAHGWTAPCHSAPRPSAAIWRACISFI